MGEKLKRLGEASHRLRVRQREPIEEVCEQVEQALCETKLQAGAAKQRRSR